MSPDMFPDTAIAHLVGRRLVVSIDGRVAGQGSKNRGRGRRFYEASKYHKPWREAVIDATKAALALEPAWDTQQPSVRVEIVFAIIRPKRHHVACSRARSLREGVPVFCPTTPDIDKAARAVLDALTQAGAIVDDRRVVQLLATKVYTGPTTRPVPGAVVVVTPLQLLEGSDA